MSTDPMDLLDQFPSFEEIDPDIAFMRKLEADPEMQLLGNRERKLVIDLKMLQVYYEPGTRITYLLDKRQTVDSVSKYIRKIAAKHGFNVEVWEEGGGVSYQLI